MWNGKRELWGSEEAAEEEGSAARDADREWGGGAGCGGRELRGRGDYGMGRDDIKSEKIL